MQLKLSTEVLIQCYQGLEALDGVEKVIKDGEKEKAVKEPFKLGPGFRLLIAKNLHVLKPFVQSYEQLQGRLLNEYSEEDGKVLKENRNKLRDALEEAQNQEQEIVLVKFKEDQLKLEENPGINGTIISKLMYMMEF